MMPLIRTNEAERLAELRALHLSGASPAPHLEAVCRTAQALFDIPIGAVSLVEEHELSFVARCGVDTRAVPRSASFCDAAILSDAVLIVEDATRDPDFRDSALVTGESGIRFYAGAPLVLRPGIRVGTLCLIDRVPRRFSQAQAEQLRDLAEIVTAHLRLQQAMAESRAQAEQRARAEEALQASEARYRDAMETAHNAILAQLVEGVIVTDATGRLVLVNEAAAALHGVARLDVEPDDYSDTYHLFTEDGAPYVPHDLPLMRAVRGETVRDARWRVHRPDGVEVLAIGSARPLIGRDGDQIGAVLTLRDDTARDAAERSLRASEAALRELNATLSDRVTARTRDAEAARLEAERASAAKSEFLAAMSHEIRTPLNAIIGFTDLMVGSRRMPPDLQRQAELVRTSGAALLTVVNDILDFSKVEAGAITLDRQGFAPRGLVDDCLTMVRGLAEQKGLRIQAVIDPAVPRSLYGDEARLRQVLLNLLNNAIKFTARGSVILSVRHTGTGEAGEALRFSVTDTGIGIPPAKHSLLFQRFSQVDGSIERDFGGTGLGLAICKQLIDLMGGEIGVQSEAGFGATFWFAMSLPLGTAGQPVAPVKRTAPPRQAGHLLVVEDNPINQELARATLEAAGHRVEIAPDGASAIRAVERTAFDLVLMDVQMPGMDGLTATRHIRRLGTAAARIPILAMTANVLPEQVRLFREAGLDDHIGKPFKQADLYAAIERWLSQGTGGARLPTGAAAEDGAWTGPAAEESGLLDRSAYDEVVTVIGPARTVSILETLVEELGLRFLAEADTVAGRDRLRFEAHSCVSSAGTLGFVALAGACRALEGCNEQRITQEGTDAFRHHLDETRALARRTARHAAELVTQARDAAFTLARAG